VSKLSNILIMVQVYDDTMLSTIVWPYLDIITSKSHGNYYGYKIFVVMTIVDQQEDQFLCVVISSSVNRGICSKAPCYCIVMEFCRQGALYDVLRCKDQTILPPQVVSWSRQIAKGMQFLHSHRIIHRDLKSPK